MKPRSLIVLLLVLAFGAGAVFFTWRYARPVTVASHDDHDHGHGHDEHGDHEEEPLTGPHGGRLLRDGDFTVELAIFERGVPPEYRAYPTLGGQLVALGEVDLTVTLTRFGGREDVVRFQAEGDALVGDREIVEPHSFAVNVVARHAGREHAWRYDSFEGRVELSAAAAARAGVTTAIAGPATLRETLDVPGRVTLNADTVTRVTPRFAGLVKSVSKLLGDRVTAGEVLAVIEANDSLQSYEVRAPRDGTVVARNVTAGGFAAAGDELYTLADLSMVWVELLVPRVDAGRIQAGQAVTLTGSGLPETTATIVTLPPFGDPESQSIVARVVVPNAEGVWRPGLFAQGTIQLGEHSVPVAVPSSSLQTFRDWTVVFLNEGTTYEVLPVTVGRRDGELVEITAGLEPGRRYVTGNSFLLKADILKSGVSHDH